MTYLVKRDRRKKKIFWAGSVLQLFYRLVRIVLKPTGMVFVVRARERGEASPLITLFRPLQILDKSFSAIRVCVSFCSNHP